MKFDTQHLGKLRECGLEPQAWVGGKLRPYAESVLDRHAAGEASLLTSKEANRDYIFKLADNVNFSTISCCVAIFGWGGMRRDHARRCLDSAKEWTPIADDLRSNKASRTEAYGRFLSLRKKGLLPGMGPAFFTKLIYFFGKSSSSRGYIMDQWTARSANLLLGEPLVHLIHSPAGSWVSDNNSELVYENFCQFIEKLADELCVETDAAEQMIFSIGNRGRKQTRGCWREYVLLQGSVARRTPGHSR